MTPRSPLLPYLEAARERVASALDRSPTDLPDPQALTSELDRVARLVHDLQSGPGKETGPVAPGEPSALALRLLELLRSEVIRAWEEESAGSGGAPPLLQVVRSFESAREVLSPGDSDLIGGAGLDGWARELLGEVAHTLGSSFGSMVFLTEVLAEGQSGEVNPLQRKQLLILHRAALTVGSMAGDILRLSGPLAEPDAEDAPGPFALDELLGEVADVLRPIMEEKRWELRAEAPSAPLRTGRSFTLKRILTNLSLALTGIDEGRRMTIAASGDEEVRFSVMVEGGIFEEDADTLTNVFPERPEGRGWRFSTAGLAVATARRLLRVQGSDLDLSADVGERIRLSFSLRLPLADPA